MVILSVNFSNIKFWGYHCGYPELGVWLLHLLRYICWQSIADVLTNRLGYVAAAACHNFSWHSDAVLLSCRDYWWILLIVRCISFVSGTSEIMCVLSRNSDLVHLSTTLYVWYYPWFNHTLDLGLLTVTTLLLLCVILMFMNVTYLLILLVLHFVGSGLF